MRKILVLFGILLLLQNTLFAATEWSKSEPAGTRSASDIDAYIGYNNTALDRLLANYRTIVLSYNSASQLTASIGEVGCSNSDGSVRKLRQNTTATTITWANIDTGTEASSTTYYVYAVADADATTVTFLISTSSSAPTGATYYKRIGSFYNDSSSNIKYITNSDGTRDAYVSPSDVSEGTSYSAGTAYQNTTNHKLMIVWYGTHCSSGGWGGINQAGYIGETSSPTTQVASVNFDLPSSGECTQSASFVVPEGWYWKVTNSAAGVAGCTATMDKIEAWEVD